MRELPSAGTPRRKLEDILARPDRDVNLAEAALLIACEEYPDLDVRGYLARLDEMGEALRQRLAEEPRPERAIMALNRYLFQELGFHGNTEQYYDPRNSFLNDVLDRRTGIPITLSTVYMEVARRAGLEVDGVGLPGHFVVRSLDPGPVRSWWTPSTAARSSPRRTARSGSTASSRAG